MTEAERISTIAAAATVDYAPLGAFQRAKFARYAASVIYHFLRAYERCTRHTYAGDIRIDHLHDIMASISRSGSYERFETIGAALAYMRQQGRDAEQATFSGYARFVCDTIHRARQKKE